jgi:hypothetical protein
MGRGKDLESYIEESIRNIREDRATVKFLLADLLAEIQKSKQANHTATHKEIGIIAAKYVETLQRSNEQLVKLTALIQKDSKAPEGLTSEDKRELFDLINSDDLGEPTG